MEVRRAWSVLGLEPCTDPAEVRAAFARRLFALHPDLSDVPGATADTIELNEAYRVALGHLTDRGDVDVREVIAVAQLADDTLALGAPGPETYRVLVDAAHRLGEVIYVEPSSGLIQVMVEFVDGPICQLLLTLQGRATGVTEAFLTIESLDDEPPPPIDAVTRLYLDTLTSG